MRENPAISDWVPISGGGTEGSLGGWLAQRQAALREVMAAGHFEPLLWGLPCVPVLPRAACVPQRGISERQRPLHIDPAHSTTPCPVDWRRNLNIQLSVNAK